jgi:Domain of unknown function (DUF4386)
LDLPKIDMTQHAADTSPQVYARAGGVLYLVIIAAGLFDEVFVRDKLIVPGAAAATANHVMASQLLWRVGVAGDLVKLACAVALALILYVLMRPAGKNLALLAAFFNLVSIAVEAAYKLHLFAALFLLGGADYLRAFEPRQLQALAYLALKSHDQGLAISLVFFGCQCMVLGVLIFRSGYLPKILGVLMQIAGLCYLVNSFALFLSPGVAALIFPAIMIPAFIGESSLCLWFIIRGVNLPKWKERLGEGRQGQAIQ